MAILLPDQHDGMSLFEKEKNKNYGGLGRCANE